MPYSTIAEAKEALAVLEAKWRDRDKPVLACELAPLLKAMMLLLDGAAATPAPEGEPLTGKSFMYCGRTCRVLRRDAHRRDHWYVGDGSGPQTEFALPESEIRMLMQMFKVKP
jgi:hypothetical protein